MQRHHNDFKIRIAFVRFMFVQIIEFLKDIDLFQYFSFRKKKSYSYLTLKADSTVLLLFIIL